MEAIVMAAGEGRRLRPLTDRWPKPILPIAGRAVVATLLRQLAAEGLGPVTVVTGHLAERVERLLDGLGVRFARQPEPNGSADAVRRALDAGAELPALVSAADVVFRPGDLARFREAFEDSGADGAVAYHRGPRRAGAAAIRVEDDLATRIPDDDPASPFAAAPLWVLSREIDREGLPGPPFELAVAFQRAIDRGKTVAGVEIGPVRGLTEPADLVLENFPYLEM